MSDTKMILDRITALRRRLDQNTAHSQTDADYSQQQGASVSSGSVLAGRLGLLERRVAEGARQNASLESILRSGGVGEGNQPPAGTPPMPAVLTAKARRLLQRGRELLHRLRDLADDLEPVEGKADETRPKVPRLLIEGDPLPSLYHETLAMTDVALRLVQTFPNSASGQLRLCNGLAGIFDDVEQRTHRISAALTKRRLERDRLHDLATTLSRLAVEQGEESKVLVALADQLIQEARRGMALSFYDPCSRADGAEPAYAIACHSLTVAGVMARLVRHDPEFRSRQQEAVLAALIHDVGMLRIPSESWLHAGPLDDSQRRMMESHCSYGAEAAARLFPDRPMLRDAVAGHHERLDGTGYPDGLREVQIAPLTRLLAVCDVYAALCVARLHRPAKDTRTAVADTLVLAEQSRLDAPCAERLLQLSFYPVGTVVELADGQTGIVTATHSCKQDLNAPARPVVALLTNRHGELLPHPQYVDLAQCEDRSIVRSLPVRERHELLGHRYPELV